MGQTDYMSRVGNSYRTSVRKTQEHSNYENNQQDATL